MATLKIDPHNHEDKLLCKRFANMDKIDSFMFELIHNLKKKCEHATEQFEADSDPTDGVYFVFEQIFELLDDCGLHMDDFGG